MASRPCSESAQARASLSFSLIAKCVFVLHNTFPEHEVQGTDVLKEYMGDYSGTLAVGPPRR